MMRREMRRDMLRRGDQPNRRPPEYGAGSGVGPAYPTPCLPDPARG